MWRVRGSGAFVRAPTGARARARRFSALLLNRGAGTRSEEEVALQMAVEGEDAEHEASHVLGTEHHACVPLDALAFEDLPE